MLEVALKETILGNDRMRQNQHITGNPVRYNNNQNRGGNQNDYPGSSHPPPPPPFQKVSIWARQRQALKSSNEKPRSGFVYIKAATTRYEAFDLSSSKPD